MNLLFTLYSFWLSHPDWLVIGETNYIFYIYDFLEEVLSYRMQSIWIALKLWNSHFLSFKFDRLTSISGQEYQNSSALERAKPFSHSQNRPYTLLVQYSFSSVSKKWTNKNLNFQFSIEWILLLCRNSMWLQNRRKLCVKFDVLNLIA